MNDGWECLQSEEDLEASVYSAEAHECHGKEGCGNEGDWHATEGFWHFHHLELLAKTREEDHGEKEADTCREGVDDAFKEIVILLDDEDGNTKNTAVGSDERKEHAKGLIEGWHGLLEHDLDHLHEGCDDEDEGYGLQVFEIVDIEHELLNAIGYCRCNDEHHGYGNSHSGCCINLL